MQSKNCSKSSQILQLLSSGCIINPDFKKTYEEIIFAPHEVIENSRKYITKPYSGGYTLDDFIKGTSFVQGRVG